MNFSFGGTEPRSLVVVTVISAPIISTIPAIDVYKRQGLYRPPRVHRCNELRLQLDEYPQVGSPDAQDKARDAPVSYTHLDVYKRQVIAIGNGTASKETEIFAADLIKELDRKVSYMMVSEAGASVYRCV